MEDIFVSPRACSTVISPLVVEMSCFSARALSRRMSPLVEDTCIFSFFSFLSIGFRGAYVEVYLPAGFAGDMETLTVKTISGEISSKIGLTARGGFLASTTSGDMLFPEVRAEKIQVSSTSGDIRLEPMERKEKNLCPAPVILSSPPDCSMAESWFCPGS